MLIGTRKQRRPRGTLRWDKCYYRMFLVQDGWFGGKHHFNLPKHTFLNIKIAPVSVRTLFTRLCFDTPHIFGACRGPGEDENDWDILVHRIQAAVQVVLVHVDGAEQQLRDMSFFGPTDQIQQRGAVPVRADERLNTKLCTHITR